MGYKYYMVLIDAFTHYIWTFPIRNKSEVQDIIRSFFSYVHTQFRLPILALQTDNGREFNTNAIRIPRCSRHLLPPFMSLHLPTKWEGRADLTHS
jgi:hypothetical protein